MYPSCASAAPRNDSGSARLPTTGWPPRFATRRAFSLLRTSAVTSWPARTSAPSTAAPMYPVAPVRKIRIADVYHNSLVVRDTQLYVLRDLAHARGHYHGDDVEFTTRPNSYDHTCLASDGS